MAGAVFTHLAVIGGSPVPAIVLLVLAGAVVWLRRAQLTALLTALATRDTR
jgi:putative oxidoreductase